MAHVNDYKRWFQCIKYIKQRGAGFCLALWCSDFWGFQPLP